MTPSLQLGTGARSPSERSPSATIIRSRQVSSIFLMQFNAFNKVTYVGGCVRTPARSSCPGLRASHRVRLTGRVLLHRNFELFKNLLKNALGKGLANKEH